MARAIDARITRDARDVIELVSVRLVDRKGRLAGLLRKRVQDGSTEDGRMVHPAVQDMVADSLVNRKDTAHCGAHAAAIPAERVDGLERDVCGSKLALNGVDTIL